jgi:CDP-diacylglycerol--glycerol-3-phosphate 3-phosphatidyltransferase
MNKELRRIGISVFAVLIISSIALVSVLELRLGLAVQWFIVSTSIWSLVWYACWTRRKLNTGPSGYPIYTSLGWANRISILRGAFIAAIGGFLLLDTTQSYIVWAVAFLYSCAAIFDRVDGYIARKTQHTSVFGMEMDTYVDALGLFIAPILAIQFGKVHPLYILAAIAFYLFQLALGNRRQRGLPTFPLHESKLRRTLAGFQMGFIAFALWPPFNASITQTTSLAFLLPLLLGFLFDWFVVSGAITPTTKAMQSFLRRIQGQCQRYLQPLLRIALAALLFEMALLGDYSIMMTVAFGFAGVSIFIGFLSALVSVGVLILLAMLPVADQPFLSILMVWLCALICLFGAGRFALFDWDDRWVARRDGEP